MKESVQLLNNMLSSPAPGSKMAGNSYLDQMFFFIVLDNAQGIIHIEKQKKIIEKLCIARTQITPVTYSLAIINDSLADEISDFGQPLLQDYSFVTFQLKPLSREGIMALLKHVMGRFDYIEELFPTFFNLVFAQFFQHSHNINEYY